MSFMGNEFSGLPIADLIGGPLNAACDAQVRLAKASADFITTVGFNPVLDSTGKPTGKLVPRQVDFSFWQPEPLPMTEVQATGTVALAGTQGGISSIQVNSIEVLGSTVNFSSSLNQLASDIAAQINMFTGTSAYAGSGNPVYTATANQATVTITAPRGTGATPNGWAVAATKTTNTGDNVAGTCTPMNGGRTAGGDSTVKKVVLSVPFLAIVNVPALMIKTVDVTFDMEVKSSESHHDSEDKQASLDATAKVGWGPFSASVTIHGSVSTHQENTSSTDRSAKYHVAVHAQDDGMPEGLSRVLDILQKAIAPVSVGQPTTLSSANVAQLTK